ncbi:type IV secretory pathway TrbD component [Pedobacter sp. UYEF25]
MSFQKFTSAYFIFIGILIGVVIALERTFGRSELFVKQFWLIFGFLAGITYIAYALVDIGIKRDPQMGVMAIMGANAVKLLFCMAFVLVYILKVPGNPTIFLVNFFSSYLLFSAFEIYCLLFNLRHQKSK